MTGSIELLTLLGIYVAAGLVFAGFFLTVGIGRVDPAAQGASVTFRVLMLPGVVALWPIVAGRWLQLLRSGEIP